MPWFQVLGFAASGYNLGTLGSYGNYAWIVPIFSGATIVVSLTGGPNRGIGALTGIAPVGAILYAFARIDSDGGSNAVNAVSEVAGHVVSVGFYVTIICSVGIILAAAYPSEPQSRPLPANPVRGRIGIALERQVVTKVAEGGSARRAGVLAGDRILSADGTWLNGDNVHDRDLISGAPGTAVALEVLRDRQQKTITVEREAKAQVEA